MPLRLRVWGRNTGAVEVEGAAGGGLGDGDGEGPAGEELGDGDNDGPAGEGLGDMLRGDALGVGEVGDALGIGEAEPEPAKGVARAGLLGEGDNPGDGDVGEAGVEGRELGEASPSAGGDVGRAWTRCPRPCRSTGGST